MALRIISPTDRTERHLLTFASAFILVFASILTLSEAARLRTWQVEYHWQHWIGVVAWFGFSWVAAFFLSRRLPDRDPFILPTAALLTGWGLLTIWRLSTSLGLRQSIWLLLVALPPLIALRYKKFPSGETILPFLRRYKYVWLTSGLLLTAATLIMGTNPLGSGPRLWLGCCGFYIQPSEPLKLLLIVYLAAYLADRKVNTSPRPGLLPLLIPTLIMTGLALLLLVFQRDLGTAAIFLALYAVIVYAGTGDWRVLGFSFLAFILAVVAGYLLFDVVSQRVDAWINPWLDPSGRSYQIVQSLLAVANGGMLGRGPGMGSPGLVPIAQSDFIFSAISEETGLLGLLALLGLLGIIANRGMRIAVQSIDPFYRLLAIGLVVHLVGQSILIIAGNIRLLPLTGVTLPFVSYGGSSLVVSFFELLCLLLISQRREASYALQPEQLTLQTRTTMLISTSLLLGLTSLAIVAGWWSLVRGPDLLTRTDNFRRTIADRYVKRGSILDQRERPLAESVGQSGSFVRRYPYADLSPIIGYTHPVYGQAGLEAGLDENLRGLQGYPALTSWWEHLLYGAPPPGLDVKLSLDLDLQTKADQLLGGEPGAIALLNAETGEILALASSPSFDANTLDTSWESLVSDPASPLYDRAGMGLYPPGTSLGAFLLAAGRAQASGLVTNRNYQDCALEPSQPTLASLVAAGCSEPLLDMAKSFGGGNLLDLLDALGLFTPPQLPIETLSSIRPTETNLAPGYISGSADPSTGDSLRVSPLQMALAAVALSNHGEKPAARLVTAFETSQSGWNLASTSAEPIQALESNAADQVSTALSVPGEPFWQVVSSGNNTPNNPAYSWYLGGTLPEWSGVPLAVAVLLEENDPSRVQDIGRLMLQTAITP